ncbi:hypothetical protein [Hafnia paralvei]|uniref:hypothetical protein n=1 Tax=Hafnia paralvei TaxID=546367 RepID=UPI000BB56755|nr:hypothetical protein [Hafnia paralvei]PNK67763.1 hypothetical protein A6J69_012265 [Hafnia paralvei]
MTKLTTERLEELANATTPSVKYVGREIIAMARQLLAYEQAAKEVACWGVTGQRGQIYPLPPQTARMDSFPLYRAPVLPKQPELVENLKKVMNSWLAMEPKLAYQPEFTDVMMLLDAEPAPAQPVIPEQPDAQDLELYIDMLENSDSDDQDGELNNTQLIMWLKELQRRRTLPAQPANGDKQ